MRNFFNSFVSNHYFCCCRHSELFLSWLSNKLSRQIPLQQRVEDENNSKARSSVISYFFRTISFFFRDPFAWDEGMRGKLRERKTNWKFRGFNPQTVIWSYKCNNLAPRQTKFGKEDKVFKYSRSPESSENKENMSWRCRGSWFTVQRFHPFALSPPQSKLRKSKSLLVYLVVNNMYLLLSKLVFMLHPLEKKLAWGDFVIESGKSLSNHKF